MNKRFVDTVAVLMRLRREKAENNPFRNPQKPTDGGKKKEKKKKRSY
jgi:hypothetical protein